MVSVTANFEERPIVHLPVEPVMVPAHSEREFIQQPSINIDELIKKTKRHRQPKFVLKRNESVETPQPSAPQEDTSLQKPVSSDQKEFLQTIYEKYLKPSEEKREPTPPESPVKTPTPQRVFSPKRALAAFKADLG